MVKNTGNVDSYYDVTLEETSTNPEFKSVIRYIINKDDKGYNEPKTLGENKYIEVGGYLKPNESSSYKVKIWLGYNADNTYMDKEFKAKVVVNAYQESNYAKDVIKNQLVKYEESSKDDFAGGLVAVNTDGNLYNETESSQEIREYRYSGPNVNNYITFNDELWRIIGVFKENGEEFVKIVRDDVLDSSYLPKEFNINNEIYKIHSNLESFPKAAYWYGKEGINDWTTAGLQYYLNNIVDDSNNNGYLSFLSKEAINMIRATTYYLGDIVTLGEYSYTTILSYNKERATTKVLEGHKATWIGKIGLMYPSDYGYSVNKKYWDNLKFENYSTAYSNSWMSTTTSFKANMSWFISPVSLSVAAIFVNGNITNTLVYNLEETNHGRDVAVMPSLYLKNDVKIIGGTGEEKNPYILSEN